MGSRRVGGHKLRLRPAVDHEGVERATELVARGLATQVGGASPDDLVDERVSTHDLVENQPDEVRGAPVDVHPERPRGREQRARAPRGAARACRDSRRPRCLPSGRRTPSLERRARPPARRDGPRGRTQPGTRTADRCRRGRPAPGGLRRRGRGRRPGHPRRPAGPPRGGRGRPRTLRWGRFGGKARRPGPHGRSHPAPRPCRASRAEAWPERARRRGWPHLFAHESHEADREPSRQAPQRRRGPSRGEACWSGARWTSTYRTLPLDPGISGASLVCHPPVPTSRIPEAANRLTDILRALPQGELDGLIDRLAIRIDPAKRIDVPSQVARALVSLPELRDATRLNPACVELMHRVAEARGSLLVSSVPPGTRAAPGPWAHVRPGKRNQRRADSPRCLPRAAQGVGGRGPPRNACAPLAGAVRDDERDRLALSRSPGHPSDRAVARDGVGRARQRTRSWRRRSASSPRPSGGFSKASKPKAARSTPRSCSSSSASPCGCGRPRAQRPRAAA